MSALSATVVIASKNRKEDLVKAVQSAVEQSVQPEVIVIDDASTDGTYELIQCQFADRGVRVIRVEKSEGYIRQRNRGASLAVGDIIFSIDDDACFSTPHVIEQTLREFNNSEIGAVAIPFINVRQDNIVRQKSPDPDQVFVTDTFIGTAHALRKEIFNRLGGYKVSFIHQCEESEYCLRMMNAGYYVRLGNSDPIHHFESPRRNMARMDYYGRRNVLLYGWYNVPMPDFVMFMVGATFNCFRIILTARRWSMVKNGILGTFAGWLGCFRYFGGRKPVEHRAYLLTRTLKKGNPLPLTATKEFADS